MGLRSLYFAIPLCAGLLSSLPARADPLTDIFPGCGHLRCVIKYNTGGIVKDYMVAAMLIIYRKIPLVMIDEKCMSACAIVTDFLRTSGVDVCITPIAEMAFHKATNYTAGIDGKWLFLSYEDTPQSPEVLRWIKKRGGFPIANTYEKMLKMPAEEASKFWRMCTPKDYH